MKRVGWALKICSWPTVAFWALKVSWMFWNMRSMSIRSPTRLPTAGITTVFFLISFRLRPLPWSFSRN